MEYSLLSRVAFVFLGMVCFPIDSVSVFGVEETNETNSWFSPDSVLFQGDLSVCGLLAPACSCLSTRLEFKPNTNYLNHHYINRRIFLWVRRSMSVVYLIPPAKNS